MRSSRDPTAYLFVILNKDIHALGQDRGSQPLNPNLMPKLHGALFWHLEKLYWKV